MPTDLPLASIEATPDQFLPGQTIDKPAVESDLLRELHQLNGASHQRFFLFSSLYLAAAGLAIYDAAIVPAPWSYLLNLPFYLLAAACLHGISLFTHEGVHGILDRDPGRNRLFSIACALPVLQNFSAYRVLHLRHHKHLGLGGDPDHYQNYSRWPALVFLMYWGRLLLGYPVYITVIPILGWQQGNQEERRWIGLELVLLAGLVGGVLAAPIPRSWLLHGWFIPMVLINTMVNIRGMSQHTLLECQTDVVRGTRTILTNPVTRFFMCNENYHLEHHLYPAVPWYHLPRLHQALRPELEQRQAPFIPSYFAFVRQFLAASFHRQSCGTVFFPPIGGESHGHL